MNLYRLREKGDAIVLVPVQIGQSIGVRYASCLLCGGLRAYHNTRTTCPRHGCQQQMKRGYQRDWQRKTHHTAIKYWKVSDTTEGQQLASTYYTLRQEIRHGRNQRDSHQASQH